MKIVAQLAAWTAVMAALLLVPAGTLAYPGAWAFVGLFTVGGLAMMAWLAKHSPRLLRERMSSPIQRDQKPWDRVWLSMFILGFLAWMMFMAWDASRGGFARVPVWLQAIGGLGVVLYMLGAWWTFRENAFAAPVVKIQEGQQIISTGPYGIVRHPMYASTVPLFIGLPLLLGSWIGLALSPLFIAAIAWRAVHEEGALREALRGYDDYARRVPYRLIRFVW